MGRARLRVLDACLTELEEANERDEVAVSEALASRLGEHVRSLVPGMTINEAIELVLREQEPHLRASSGESARSPRTVREPLDAPAASALTERIRRAQDHVCLLLLEAHEGRAAATLGYRSWAQYVQREFGLSRRRSYELLDQGRVIRAVQAAAGMRGIPHISAHAAEEIKAQLQDVTSAIRRRVDGLSETDRQAVAMEAVGAARARARRLAEPDDRHQGAEPAVGQLVEAIDVLATMPPPEEIACRITPEQACRLHRLEGALRWLAEFAQAWERHGTLVS
jgi:hypothetical protein